MVYVCTDKYVFFAKVLVIALEDTRYVAGAQSVAVLYYEETVALVAGEHGQPCLIELVVEICRRFLLSFAAGFAALHLSRTQIFDVSPEVRGEILRSRKDCGQEGDEE